MPLRSRPLLLQALIPHARFNPLTHECDSQTEVKRAKTWTYQASMTTESPPALGAVETVFSTTSPDFFLVIPPLTDPFFGGIFQDFTGEKTEVHRLIRHNIFRQG